MQDLFSPDVVEYFFLTELEENKQNVLIYR